jgi:hypothetical protein
MRIDKALIKKFIDKYPSGENENARKSYLNKNVDTVILSLGDEGQEYFQNLLQNEISVMDSINEVKKALLFYHLVLAIHNYVIDYANDHHKETNLVRKIMDMLIKHSNDSLLSFLIEYMPMDILGSMNNCRYIFEEYSILCYLRKNENLADVYINYCLLTELKVYKETGATLSQNDAQGILDIQKKYGDKINQSDGWLLFDNKYETVEEMVKDILKNDTDMKSFIPIYNILEKYKHSYSKSLSFINSDISNKDIITNMINASINMLLNMERWFAKDNDLPANDIDRINELTNKLVISMEYRPPMV